MHSVQLFSIDTERSVRHALLEVCGDLIHTFKDDPEGPPELLLDFFFDRHEGSTTPKITVPAIRRNLLSGPSLLSPEDFGNTFTCHPVDVERSQICAFNLPAVVLTLGEQNWDKALPLFNNLCSCPQNRVRKSLASGIHELAVVLGPEITEQDLLPRWQAFLHDCADIKERSLSHLDVLFARFTPKTVAAQLNLFRQEWDNSFSKWRLRQQIINHLPEILAKADYIEAIGIALIALIKLALRDRYLSVREEAMTSMWKCLNILTSGTVGLEADGLVPLILGIVSSLAHSSVSSERKSFALLCGAAVLCAQPLSIVQDNLLGPLNKLCEDSILGVRIAAAEAFRQIAESDFLFGGSPNHLPPILSSAISKLSQDQSEYVRIKVKGLPTASPLGDLTSVAISSPKSHLVQRSSQSDIRVPAYSPEAIPVS